MAYMCLDCYEVYHESIKDMQKEWMECLPCPKTNCSGIVIELDELLLVAIKILNQKGYFTRNCCSGHVYDSCVDSYIQFDDDVDLPSLPKGYKDDKDLYPHAHEEKTNCIRRKFTGNSEVEIQEKIFENAKEVLKWAESLEMLEW